MHIFKANPHSRAIAGTILTLTAFASSANILPSLITTISNDIGTDFNNFGYIIMLQFFSFFLAGISGAAIGEKLGLDNRKLVLCGLIILSLTLFSGVMLGSMPHFFIWIIPLGFGGGLVETFSSVMISNQEKANSGRLLNLSQVFYCLGAIVSPQLIALFLYLGVPWKPILITFGVLILLITYAFMSMTKGQTALQQQTVCGQENSGPGLLGDCSFYLLGSAMLFYVILESIFACWLAVYFEKALSFPPQYAAIIISLFWSGLILGRLLIAAFPNMFKLWKLMILCSIMICISVLVSGIFSLPAVTTVMVFLTGLSCGPLWPTIVAICRSVKNSNRFTSSVIATGALGVVIGSFAGGAIFRHFDLKSFFPAMFVLSLILLTVVMISHAKIAKAERD
jgi:fucose permease